MTEQKKRSTLGDRMAGPMEVTPPPKKPAPSPVPKA